MDLLKECHATTSAVYIFIICLTTYTCVGEELQTTAEEPFHCYQCHSTTEPECTLLVNASKFYKACPSPPHHQPHDYQPFCRKIVQIIRPYDEAYEVVVRGCGWVQHPSQDCYSTRNIDHKQRVCQCFTPGCNTGAATLASLIILAVALTATTLV